MLSLSNPTQWFLGIVLILASLGVITAKKPIYASLSFLLSLIALAAFYLSLSAPFIAVMQVFVYAGAILVIFVFVIVLFQDAHQQISRFIPRSNPFLLSFAGVLFLLTFLLLAVRYLQLESAAANLPSEYGSVQTLGTALYLDFFFPFEAIVLLFLVAAIGAFYIAKKET